MTGTSRSALGPVLVTGGCGFLGYTLVRQLLDDAECSQVYVVDRDISKNVHHNAQYMQADICDTTAVGHLLTCIQPRTIFNLASPNFSFPKGGRADFYNTNVKGTEVLLDLCKNATSVKAFVHCSSMDIYAHPPHSNVDETHPTAIALSDEPYAQTKAMADALVLAANGPSLRTTTLRLSHMYGARCSQQLQVLLDMCAGNRVLFQLGPGTNLMSVVSADNASAAHILAAKALLNPTRAHGKVDGEAFNISDGTPVSFWRHTALFWSAARGRSVNGELIVIPAWLVKLVFGVVAWFLWLFTLGHIDPPASMSSTALSYALENRTCSSLKAAETLGFRPVVYHDEIIKESVLEELARRETQKAESGRKKD